MVTLVDQRVNAELMHYFLALFPDGRNVGAATATTGTRNADSIFLCVFVFAEERKKMRCYSGNELTLDAEASGSE